MDGDVKSKYRALLDNWHRPRWWSQTVLPYLQRTLVREPILSTMAAYYSRFGDEGCHVMDEDWDNLVILDACRYDTFANINTISGTLSRRRSKGSATVEFLQENFGTAQFHDTVYVNAHPNVTRHLRASFHDRIDVWRDAWSDDLNTVPPGPVTDVAKNAHRRYPDKRIVVHYLQPHCPFIGEWGQASMNKQAGIEYTKAQVTGETPANDPGAYYAWNQLRRGLVSVETVRRAYRENLELVLPHVEELVAHFDGKTVITSDHGNLFGEYVFPSPIKLYEHPPGIHTDHLVTVPWLTITGESRKEIVTKPPTDERETPESEELHEHLKRLGYAGSRG